MKSYSLTDAANLIIKEAEDEKSKYKTFRDTLIDFNIFYRGTINDGYYKNKKILLSKQFKYEYPKEAELYFEEYYTEQGFYQLKVTELGIKELYNFILRELGKELF